MSVADRVAQNQKRCSDDDDGDYDDDDDDDDTRMNVNDASFVVTFGLNINCIPRRVLSPYPVSPTCTLK